MMMAVLPALLLQLSVNAQTPADSITIDQIVKSNRDILTEFALSQPDGPNYESLVPLMTPVRWVTAEFHHFPVVLSAPSAPVKARLASNGGALSPFANYAPTWKEAGRELDFFVGAENEPFGSEITRTEDGRWQDGYLAVWVVRYQTKNQDQFTLRVYAPVEPVLAAQGALAFEIRLDSQKPAAVKMRLAKQNNQARLNEIQKKAVKNDDAQTWQNWLKPGTGWQLQDEKSLEWSGVLQPGQSFSGLLLTRPSQNIPDFDFETSRALLVKTWNDILQSGPKWSIPEPLIENAWKSHLIALHMIVAGNRPNYSAINAYDHLYMTEGSDLLRGLAYWGQIETLDRVIDAQFSFLRKDTLTSVSGLKLSLIRDLIELTGRPELLANQEPNWQQASSFILDNLNPENGLPKADRYAGDLGGAVFNLRSSALCWKGIRDLSTALHRAGREAEAAKLNQAAATLKLNIMKALESSEKLSDDPDFVPIGFFGKDKPVQRIPDTQLSSYYNLILGNVIDSGILDRTREDKIFRYLEQRAGLSLGMPRTKPFWKTSPYYDQDGIVPLYGLKYAQARLRRDQPDHAVATLYGWLAHGMTRHSFIHGEGVRYTGGDKNGRFFHLPPNSTSSANWLTLLRFLMVHEIDFNNDSNFDTLRLLDAVPRAWLADGRRLSFADVPTRYGPISLTVESELSKNQVHFDCNLPKNQPESVTIQFRLPGGYQAVEMQVDGKTIKPAKDGRFDLSVFKGRIKGVVQVKK